MQAAVSAASDGAQVGIPPQSPPAQPLSKAVINAAVARMQQEVVEAAEHVRAAPAEKQQALLNNLEAHVTSALLISRKGWDGAGLKLGLPEIQRQNVSLKRSFLQVSAPFVV
jgi:hypothetical protein